MLSLWRGVKSKMLRVQLFMIVLEMRVHVMELNSDIV